MSRFLTGNLFLFLSMLCAACSQIVLKGVLHEVNPPGLAWSSWRPLFAPERFVRGGLALSLIGVGFVFWVLCLARLEQSYAYPIACSSILLVALFSTVFLGEPMTARSWAGTVLVLIGIILLTPRA